MSTILISASNESGINLSFPSVDDEVIVRLKWSQMEYTGRLVSVDSYMNIQLSGAEEWRNGKSEGILGQVLIRCV